MRTRLGRATLEFLVEDLEKRGDAPRATRVAHCLALEALRKDETELASEVLDAEELPEVLRAFGRLLCGDPAAALEILGPRLGAFPPEGAAHFVAGLAEGCRRRTQEARSRLERARELLPGWLAPEVELLALDRAEDEAELVGPGPDGPERERAHRTEGLALVGLRAVARGDLPLARRCLRVLPDAERQRRVARRLADLLAGASPALETGRLHLGLADLQDLESLSLALARRDPPPVLVTGSTDEEVARPGEGPRALLLPLSDPLTAPARASGLLAELEEEDLLVLHDVRREGLAARALAVLLDLEPGLGGAVFDDVAIAWIDGAPWIPSDTLRAATRLRLAFFQDGPPDDLLHAAELVAGARGPERAALARFADRCLGTAEEATSQEPAAFACLLEGLAARGEAPDPIAHRWLELARSFGLPPAMARTLDD